MSQIDRQVLEIVARAAAPLSESAIGLQVPGVHNEIVASCLRRLREKQQLERSELGLWSVKGQPVVVTKETSMANSAPRKCGKCGGTDFTPAGKCRPCKKLHNAKYLAKKGGKPLPPPSVATRQTAKRAKGVPLQMHGDRMVIMQFAIRIEDSAGVTHDLFLTGDVVKRLAIELQEFA